MAAANVMARGMFQTSGSTTVNATSNAGQPVLNVADESAFFPGAYIVIDSGGANEERNTVLSRSAGQLTLTDNLTNTQTASTTVAVENLTSATYPRQYANDFNFDSYAMLTQTKGEHWIVFDMGSLVSISGYFIQVKNAGLVTSTATITLYWSSDGIAWTQADSNTNQTLNGSIDFGLKTWDVTVLNKQYYAIRIDGTLSEAIKISAAGVFQKTTLSRMWDIQTSRLLSGNHSTIIGANGAIHRQAFSTMARKGYDVVFRNITDAHTTSLRSVFEEGTINGRLPMIVQSADIDSGAFAWYQFADDRLEITQLDFDLNMVRMSIVEPIRARSGNVL